MPIETLQPMVSPVPNSKKEEKKAKAILNFYEALKEVANGNRITRIDWQDPNLYGFMHEKDGSKQLAIRTEEAETVYRDHTWIISIDDMEAEDWIVL